MPMIDRRAALQRLFGAALAPWASQSAFAQNAANNTGRPRLQPIRMGIQIFTGAVATVWVEKKIYEQQHFFTVDARQMAAVMRRLAMPKAGFMTATVSRWDRRSQGRSSTGQSRRTRIFVETPLDYGK